MKAEKRTAHDLAYALEKDDQWCRSSHRNLTESAAMLRRQSSEIERLEARVKELTEALKVCHSTLKILGDASDRDVSPAAWYRSGGEASELTALNLILQHDRALLEKSNG